MCELSKAVEQKEVILQVRNLCKKYGKNQVLRDISMDICRGDIFGILGLSGAGKSTLVRCLNGLEKYDSGSIMFNGQPVTFDRAYRRKVAMIFQQFNLLDQRTVIKNVQLPGELCGEKDTYSRALELLQLVGLEDKINDYPSQLSGGQRQRVAIARALMSNPEVLLCDECTSSLDPDTANQILQLLLKLNKQCGLTVIMISHQMDIIEKICNKVAIIDNAEIVEMGNAQDIFLFPKTEVSQKIIYSGHINTTADKSKLLKLVFNGEIDTPLVANIIQDCNIVISIIYADSKVVEGRVYGQLILTMPAEQKDAEKLLKYLQLQNIHYEEVRADGFN